MIRRLAYVSRPRPNLPLVEIPRIVAICRAHNEMDGITGVLLFTGLDFAQLIEGELDVVAALWARIQADDRHRDIHTFLDERAPSRWFPDWRVGFPSDSTVVGQIAAWREGTRLWTESERADLRGLLATADTL
jgi:Sensors of blue-light using FAD